MKVLRQGNPRNITYKIECKCCGCVILCTDGDTKEDASGKYVECPTCAEKLHLVDGKKINKDYDFCDWCLHAKSHGWEGNECTLSKANVCKTNGWSLFQEKQAIR